MPRVIKDLLGDVKRLTVKLLTPIVSNLSKNFQVKTLVEARLLLPEFVDNFRRCLSDQALSLQMRFDERPGPDVPDNVVKIGRNETKGVPPEGHDLERIDEIILHYRQRGDEVTYQYSFKNIWQGGYSHDLPDPEIIVHSNIPGRKGQPYQPR